MQLTSGGCEVNGWGLIEMYSTQPPSDPLSPTNNSSITWKCHLLWESLATPSSVTLERHPGQSVVCCFCHNGETIEHQTTFNKSWWPAPTDQRRVLLKTVRKQKQLASLQALPLMSLAVRLHDSHAGREGLEQRYCIVNLNTGPIPARVGYP